MTATPGLYVVDDPIGARADVRYGVGNTASGNGDDGIDVGADGDFDGSRSLLTGNTAADDGDVGIEAQCPSTVTFNNAAGNDLDYNLVGTPCDAHNNTPTGTPP